MPLDFIGERQVRVRVQEIGQILNTKLADERDGCVVLANQVECGDARGCVCVYVCVCVCMCVCVCVCVCM